MSLGDYDPRYPTPEVPKWLQHVQSDKEFQIQFLKQDGSLHWASNRGAQTWVLQCPFDEILIGGRRGGSKSAALISWMAMGDTTLPLDDPARYSFLNDPSYRGLLLRKEYQSMVEFVDECMDFYRPFGVKAVDDPVVLRFKSGAKIYTNHLGTPDAYEKYRGQGITRIGVEELTQIPELRWYLKLLGSLRGKKQERRWTGLALQQFFGTPERMAPRIFPALRCQIMSTANPDGPGKMWVKHRFVKMKSKGRVVEPNTPLRDPVTSLTRIYIPMRKEDNPYLRDNKQYEGMLLAQDEVTRRQWLEGDWDAGTGMAFSEFRPNGPIGEEKVKYPWANHVIESCELKPWWFRWGGGDWGFEHPAVFHKCCMNQADHRIHVYDEISFRHTGSYEMGVLLANWWLPDLEFLPDKSIVIALSPDAFAKTDSSNTKAEQMEAGIKQVLGPYGAIILRYNDDERLAMTRDPALAEAMFERRKSDFMNGQMAIALKPAQTDRIAGWSFIHEKLRWRQVRHESQEELKLRLVQVFQSTGSVEAYERELAKAKVQGPEVLPQMLLWGRCKGAIRCLEEAQTDVEAPGARSEDVMKWNADNGEGGDDPLDSLRHAMMQFKAVEVNMPRSYWVGEKIADMQEDHVRSFGYELTDPTRLAMISSRQNQIYSKMHSVANKQIFLPRASSMRHRKQ